MDMSYVVELKPPFGQHGLYYRHTMVWTAALLPLCQLCGLYSFKGCRGFRQMTAKYTTSTWGRARGPSPKFWEHTICTCTKLNLAYME